MDGKAKITSDTLVSTTELASVLGVTARRVQQLIQDGTIVASTTKGKFPLCDAVQRYIIFIQKNTSQDADIMKAEKVKIISEASLKKSKADMAKKQADELAGRMHRAEDVRACMTDMVFAFRTAILSLPGRCAVDVAGTADAAEAAEIIRQEVYKVAEDLSHYQYDPEKYAQRVRERLAQSEAPEAGEYSDEES